MARIKEFVKTHPLIVHAVVYVILVICLALTYNSQTNSDEDITTRIIKIEQDDPCGQKPLKVNACIEQLDGLVKLITANQACVLVEKAGLNCRVERVPTLADPNQPSDPHSNPGNEPSLPSQELQNAPEDAPEENPGETNPLPSNPPGDEGDSPPVNPPSNPPANPPSQADQIIDNAQNIIRDVTAPACEHTNVPVIC